MKVYGKFAKFVVAVAALAVSGAALADHGPGNGKDKDKGNGPGPKVSIDITVICKFGDGSADNPLPDNILRVTTTVEDVSDDPRRAIELDTISVKGLQFYEPVEPPKKDKWKEVGAVVDSDVSEVDMYTREFVHDINVCEPPRVEDGAKALNAHVQVMLPDGRNFMRMCDDIKETEEVDESRIDLDAYDPSESCSK